MHTHTLNLESVIELSDEQFYQLCRRNPDLRFERSATGELIIMSPTGSETSENNFSLYLALGNWNLKTKLGHCFESNGGFTLPNGAVRVPDMSWIRNDRYEALSKKQRTKFAPICPDFVMELMSPTDELRVVQAKMVEYIENGARLGWLINPKTKQVEIYRPSQESGYEKELLEMPQTLSGEDVLPGFELDLGFMWEE
jgi:Uma2 family endonuclease